MANLIITVIAIALVAVASLMGAYYGGSAFLNNQQAANASTAINEGQQINGAWQAYLNDNNGSDPTNMDLLVTKQYLAAFPTAPVAQGYSTNSVIVQASATPTGGSLGQYVFMDMGAAGATNASACQHVLHAATGATSAPATARTVALLVTPTTTIGNGSFGCATSTAAITGVDHTGAAATVTAGDFAMYYKLQ